MHHGLTTIDRVFTAALDLPDADRSELLERVGREDPDLKEAVERLLRSSDQTDPLLVPGGAQSGPIWHDLSSDLLGADELGEGARIGRYRIIQEIGEGGMAVVLLASREDRCYDQNVALKILRAGIDTDEVVRRFSQERQILASLRHPGIARLVDGGRTASGRPYLVMEYVDGRPIDTYCEELSLGVEKRLELLLAVARAVSYAHQNLVVHRDLKPSNILVTRDGHVKLLDFGIAKLLSEEASPCAAPLTRIGVRAMTPEYASPEQMRGEEITTASDVYQLGLLLYELLSGSSLCRPVRCSITEAERVICEHQPPLPSVAVRRASGRAWPAPFRWARRTPLAARRRDDGQLHRLLRGDLDAVVLCALQKSPLERYATVELLCEDLERWLRGEPVVARGHAFGYRVWSLLRRRFRVVAAAAASLLLVASLTILYTSRLSQERDRARAEAEKAKQISSFIVQVFQGANPERVQGRQVTARQLLDLGAQQIGSELEGQLLTQAELAALFAELNCRVGAPERAAPLLEQALDLAQTSGASAEWKAQVMRRLARLYRARGEPARADLLLAHARLLTGRRSILDRAVVRTALTGGTEPRAGEAESRPEPRS